MNTAWVGISRTHRLASSWNVRTRSLASSQVCSGLVAMLCTHCICRRFQNHRPLDSFKFDKRCQLFVRSHNETFAVAAVRVSNEDRSSARVHSCNAASTPSGFRDCSPPAAQICSPLAVRSPFGFAVPARSSAPSQLPFLCVAAR